MPFCTDCRWMGKPKHRHTSDDGYFTQCKRPSSTTGFPVNYYIDLDRSAGGDCGPRGKYFEPKDPSDQPVKKRLFSWMHF